MKDNYNKRNPPISFRLTDYYKSKLEKEAEKRKMESLSELCKDIIDKFLTGQLVEAAQNKDAKMQDLKMEKLSEEIRYLKIKNDFAENFDKPISNSGTRMIKPAITTNNEIINGVSPYDADHKRLQCTDCGILVSWNDFSSYLVQIKEYKQHILSRHNRELTAIEKDVIDNLKYEGKSK
tara:strand:- start:93 stop:629 length:537 start_codon:yes stop_codon:yes gene_type:complete